MIDVTQLTETITTTVGNTLSSVVDAATKQFDTAKFDLRKLDVTNIDLSTFDVSKFDLPKLDMPVEIDRVADLARDVTYAGIGMWVVAAQKVDAEVRKLAAKAA